MIIGLQVGLSLQNSNVGDNTNSLDDYVKNLNCQNIVFNKGLKIKGDGDVGIYIWDKDNYVVPTINLADKNSKITKDGVYFDTSSCSLQMLKQVTNGKQPKQPDEYSCWDTVLEHRKWKCRYFRVKAHMKSNGFLSQQWRVGDLWYYMFWEETGGCNRMFRWSAKDMTCKPIGNRQWEHYLRKCMQYDTKFNAAKDLKAEIHRWYGSNSNRREKETILFTTMIERGGYVYFRTNVDAPIEYKAVFNGDFSNSPAKVQDIDGFVKHESTANMKPFDGKNYTKLDIIPDLGFASYTVMSTDVISGIALGHVACDYINVVFKDINGKILEEINNYAISNTLTNSNDNEPIKNDMEYPITTALYASTRLPAETVIVIEFYGKHIVIGEIFGFNEIAIGRTNLAFTTKVRDFSPKQQDQWGNIYYDEGIRVKNFTGTVEFAIQEYDRIHKVMLYMIQKKVFVDGSSFDINDKNKNADSYNIFQATKMIGRFTSFDMSTTEDYKSMNRRGKINFNLEETV